MEPVSSRKVTARIFAAVQMFLLFSISAANVCPEKCVCQWRNGLPTADCSNLNLTSIPTNIPSNVLVLDLSGNRIPHIKNSTFLINNLAHLLKLDLSHSEVSTVDSSAFMGMSNLRELNLDGNNFEEFPAATFVGIPNLRLLSLRFNRLKTIPNYAFKTLDQLETLDLQSSQINQIDPEGFRGLENLRSLQLNGNQLRRLTLPTLAALKSLQQLDLHENPWNCDCRVRDLILWMKQRKVGSGYRATCQTPEIFRNAAWDIIPLKKLACASEILSMEAYNIIPGHNISAECTVFGDPAPRVLWYHDNQPINFEVNNKTKYESYSQNLTSHVVHILIIRNASHANDAGIYQCFATNWAGNATGNIELFHSGGILNTTGTTILLIGLISAITIAGLVLYCRRKQCRALVNKLGKVQTAQKNSKETPDSFNDVTYYKSPNAILSPPNNKPDETASLLTTQIQITTDIQNNLNMQTRSNYPTCTRENETLHNAVITDRVSEDNHNDEDKDSGIQHEEDSVRNESSTDNDMCTPQDMFTDSDHESVVKPVRNVTFSPATCFTPSSLRRSPGPNQQTLKMNLVPGYDPYLGTEV